MKSLIFVCALLSSTLALADVIRGAEAYKLISSNIMTVKEAVDQGKAGYEIMDTKCVLAMKSPTLECHLVHEECHLELEDGSKVAEEAACSIKE